MLELLKELLSFVLQLGEQALGLLTLILGSVSSMLVLLHTEMPRLEGLLVGVLLAWLLARRDRHPLLRALSAPLKLIVDILDLIWDQCIEFVKDIWGTAMKWAKSTVDWTLGKVKSAWKMLTNGLTGIKNKLSKK
jgi:hypothetical protein